MKTLTIKGVPDAVYRELKRRAREHRRSLNGEALVMLERAFGAALLTPGERLARIDAVREGIKGPYITNEEIDRLKREGRP